MTCVQVDFREQQLAFCSQPTQTLVARQLAEVLSVLQQAQALANAGHVVVGFVSYEAAPAFDPAFCVRAGSPLPLAWFAVCDEQAALPPPGQAVLSPMKATLNEQDYLAASEAIHRYLRDGETYQLNFSFALQGALQGSASDWFATMRPPGNQGYFACIETDEWAVISLSPELFFAAHDRAIVCRPMKGTRRRGLTTQEDRLIADELTASEKDRAENVMIVDLLRNDLGRICEPGSIQPGPLFCVERHPTVLQMTSQVSGRLRPGSTLVDWFRALFPCGSVTGAPKVRTMQRIAELEEAGRGVYCGTVGCLSPQHGAVFNVAIRTLTVQADASVTYRVGSGIVADSDSHDEYRECLLKARLIRRSPLDFSLLETLCWQPDSGYLLLEEHIDRLLDSAAYFGFPLVAASVRAALQDTASSWTDPQRVRLLVRRDGALALTHQPLPEPASSWRLKLLPGSVNSDDLFLYHKTTNRAQYDQARRQMGDADDVLLVNERGEITETSIANIAIQLDGVWVTPPISSGLLAGTLRATWLRQGKLQEQVVHVHDLPRVTGYLALNSVRGAISCTISDS